MFLYVGVCIKLQNKIRELYDTYKRVAIFNQTLYKIESQHSIGCLTKRIKNLRVEKRFKFFLLITSFSGLFVETRLTKTDVNAD